MTMGPIGEIAGNRELLWRMTVRDFKSKYAGSLMGVFWTVINPLLLLAIFTFVFTVVFKARFGGRDEIGVSAVYILCGILPWLMFQEGIGRAGTVMLENKNLVTRARFPLSVLPAHPALSAMLGQLAGMVILAVLGWATVQPPALPLVLLPILLLFQLVFTVGLALFISAASVYVRDVIQVLPVLLLVWFYGTPVFYPAELVPETFGILITLNPMAHLVSSYRLVLLEGAWPDPVSMVAIAAFAFTGLATGSLVFNKLSDGFADRL